MALVITPICISISIKNSKLILRYMTTIIMTVYDIKKVIVTIIIIIVTVTKKKL
jgi:hypothetical protein